ncbi:MAG: hypothetical protein EXR73_09770 [Myxococcales bacterium]|nr:hypothetical protein [Myxococcales bacterium]
MANVTRKIGLSLGADLCWPACYEQILERLALSIDWQGDRVAVESERVTIEPFDLRQSCRYDVVLDRLTHWYHLSREWIKKAVLMDGLYVLNNPWSVQAMEKHTSYCAMIKLGMPIPETWMLPPKSYVPTADLQPTLKRYARLFDLGAVGREVGYPAFIKPYDGGGWRGVSRVDDDAKLRRGYEDSGNTVLHVQKAVDPFDRFVRCIGFGPQTHLVSYDADAPLHDRYTRDKDFVTAAEAQTLRDTTLTINTFFGWDFNSCEALRGGDGVWYPIDFANACPDSQVTSLHYHFPWLVKAYLRWSIYCAVTKRKMRRTLDWEPYYAIADLPDMSYPERLRAYGKIAEERLEAARFEEFCAKHLGHLDEVAWEFFGTQAAKTAVREKVNALFPAHEVEAFTSLFFGRIQEWRADNASQQASPLVSKRGAK